MSSAAPSRQDRERCWAARDVYFECLDRHDILDPLKSRDDVIRVCASALAGFEQDCSASWVQYFSKKRVQDYYKQKQLEELHKRGAVPLSGSFGYPSNARPNQAA